MDAEHVKKRLGKLTASRLADAFAKTRTGWGASRERLLAELTIERLTNAPYPSYQSAAMQQGIEREPMARAAYSFEYDVDVELTGFHEHPTIPMSGASPDGLIGLDGLVEFKNPQSHTHYHTLLSDFIDGAYILQVQWQMSCTGRQWADFVSFDPVWPAHLRMYVRRIQRDNMLIASLEAQVRDFLAELDQKMELLQIKRTLPPDIIAVAIGDPAVLPGEKPKPYSEGCLAREVPGATCQQPKCDC